jgi:hypothetical protein
MLTPAQKPRGLAKMIFMSCLPKVPAIQPIINRTKPSGFTGLESLCVRPAQAS